MNRIRTIQGAADELRKRDPGCAISAHNIRQLVLHKGKFPAVKPGQSIWVALDDVERLISGLPSTRNEPNHGIG
ncbi:MAG: hypothetical protein ACLUOA_06930 [Gemmiger formicilis]|uniref:hypothetical protein n=1 Tax=Gemmiger formicilis TaxID=745368 RepID=UPI003992CE13